MDDKPGFIKQFISSLFGRYERIGGGTPEERAAFRAAYQSVQDDPAFINQFAQQNPDLVNEDSKKPYSVRGVLTRSAIVIAVFEEVFRRDLLSNLATFHHRKSMLAKLKKQFDIMMKRRVQLQDAVMRNAERIKSLTAEQRKLLEEMRQLLDQYHNLSNQYSNLMDELMGLSTRLEALEVERIELKESVWKLHVDIHEGITNARQQLSEILPPNSRLLIAIAKLEQEKVEVNKEESLEDLHESNKNALEELYTL